VERNESWSEAQQLADLPFGVGQGTTPLPTKDVMDQAVMLVHKLGQAYGISSLSLTKQIGNFGVAYGRIGHGVSPFCS
jgi:hypothetical protein